jgi:hypothetical protein
MTFEDFKDNILQRYPDAYKFTEFEGVYCCTSIISGVTSVINYSNPSEIWVVVCNYNTVRHEGKGPTINGAFENLRPT